MTEGPIYWVPELRQIKKPDWFLLCICGGPDWFSVHRKGHRKYHEYQRTSLVNSNERLRSFARVQSRESPQVFEMMGIERPKE